MKIKGKLNKQNAERQSVIQVSELSGQSCKKKKDQQNSLYGCL
jgi:hypothetical protein